MGRKLPSRQDLSSVFQPTALCDTTLQRISGHAFGTFQVLQVPEEAGFEEEIKVAPNNIWGFPKIKGPSVP